MLTTTDLPLIGRPSSTSGGLEPLLGRPSVVCHHGKGALDPDHLAHAADCTRRQRLLADLRTAAEHRRMAIAAGTVHRYLGVDADQYHLVDLVGESGRGLTGVPARSEVPRRFSSRANPSREIGLGGRIRQ